MKVLFVSSGTSKDGISTLVFNQGESLKRMGVSVEYFTINRKGFSGYFTYTFKLKKHLKRNSYNIIHAHYGLSGLVAVFAKQKRQKLIISFMGTDILGIQKGRRQTLFGKFLVLLNKRAAKYADHIVVKSNEMYNMIGIRNKSVIPNGVNLNQFKPSGRSAAIERLGWVKEKRHLFFMADPSRPEKNYSLAKSALQLLQHKNVELHLLRDITPSKVVHYYIASDACLLTSYYEGSPNVIKEAMACNRPVISTDVGDVAETIGNTEGCYLTSFNPFEIAEKIDKALQFSMENGETKGRERIIQLGLESSEIASRLIEVYQKVLK